MQSRMDTAEKEQKLLKTQISPKSLGLRRNFSISYACLNILLTSFAYGFLEE